MTLISKFQLRTYPSIKFLQERVTEVFEGQTGSTPAFPGYQCDLQWPSDKVIDVVLFGDAAFSLMITDLWPLTHQYRLWVLNEQFRKGLCRLFQLNENQIGLVPRELLLKRKNQPLNFPETDELNFVICGRTRRAKHFRLSCAVANFLQKNVFGKRMKVHVFTPNTFLKDLPKKMPELDWVTRPKLWGEKGPDWISLVPENSVLINLSIDPMDDFNVSCAQAQEQGWPLIIPERGPYLDITGNSVIPVPLNLLGPEDDVLDENQIEEVAMHILGAWHSSQFIASSKEILKSPAPMDFKTLKGLKSRLIPEHQQELRYYPHYENIWDRSVFKIWDNR